MKNLFVFLVLFVCSATYAQNKWESVWLPHSIECVDVHAYSDSEIVASDRYCVYGTTNGGKTWKVLHANGRSKNEGTLDNICTDQDGHPYYIASGYLTTSKYFSFDHGRHWNVLGISAPAINQLYFSKDTLYATSNNTGYDNLYRSVDSGKKFTRLPYELTGLSGNSSYLFVWKDNTIYRTANGGEHWDTLPRHFTSIWKMLAREDGTIYIASRDEGVSRSLDNGLSWDTVQGGYEIGRWPQLVTTGTVDWIFHSDNSIYYSADRGSRWERIEASLTGDSITRISVSPAGTLFAATKTGIYRSQYPYSVFQKIGLPVPTVTKIWIERSRQLYASIGTEIISVPIGAFSSGTSIKAPIPQRIFGTSLGNTASGNLLLGSENNGAHIFDAVSDSWKLLPYGFGSPTGSSQRNIFGVVEGTATGNIYAAGSEGLFRLKPNAPFWEELSIPGIDVCFSLTSLSNNRMLVGQSGSIYEIRDSIVGTPWKRLHDLPGSLAPVRAIYQTSSSAILAGTQGAGIIRSEQSALTWSDPDSLSLGPVVRAFWETDSSIILAGTLGRGIFRSTDDGKMWVRITGGTIPDSIFGLAGLPDGTIFASSLNRGLYRSQDKGLIWHRLNTLADSTVYKVHVVNNLVYVSTRNMVYRSTDGGEHWQGLPIYFDQSPTHFDMSRTGTLAGSFTHDSSIYRSTDQGRNWQQVHLDLTDSLSYLYGLASFEDSTFYTSVSDQTGIGGTRLYRSRDDGKSWQPATALLPVRPYYLLAADPPGNIYGARTLNTYEDTSYIDKIQIADADPFSFVYKYKRQFRSLLAVSNKLVLAGHSNGFIRYTPAGHVLFDTGMFYNRVITFERGSGNEILAGVGTSVYRSIDEGISWTILDTALAWTVQDLLYDNGFVYAATSLGVWRLKTGPSVDIDYPVLVASDVSFGNVVVGKKICKEIILKNTGMVTFTIQGGIFEHSGPEFNLDPTSASRFPLTLSPGAIETITVCYTPDAPGEDANSIAWQTDIPQPYASEHKAITYLNGKGVLTNGVEESTPTRMNLRPNPADERLSMSFEPTPVARRLDIFDVLGNKVASEIIAPQASLHQLDLRTYPEGAYYARLGNRIVRFVKVNK